VSKKHQYLSKPGILVFVGTPRLFGSYEEAERYAESMVRDTDEPVQFATILPNTQPGGDRTVMDTAVVVVDRGIVASTAEDAVEYGYLADPEED
jgi:hypothetical protein